MPLSGHTQASSKKVDISHGKRSLAPVGATERDENETVGEGFEPTVSRSLLRFSRPVQKAEKPSKSNVFADRAAVGAATQNSIDNTSPPDDDLQQVIAVWHRLPNEVRGAISAMVYAVAHRMAEA